MKVIRNIDKTFLRAPQILAHSVALILYNRRWYGAQGQASMTAYRIFLRSQNRIIGRQDFSAEDEATAKQAAALVFDACNPQCDAWELWEGTRLVSNPLLLRSEELARRFEEALELTEEKLALSGAHVEEAAVFIEEGLMRQTDRDWHRTRFAERIKEIRSKIHWRDSFVVGHIELDREHYRLLNAINNISVALSEGRDTKQVMKLVEAFKRMAGEHFLHEAAIMREIASGGGEALRLRMAPLMRKTVRSTFAKRSVEHEARHATALDSIVAGSIDQLGDRLRAWFLQYIAHGEADLRTLFQL